MLSVFVFHSYTQAKASLDEPSRPITPASGYNSNVGFGKSSNYLTSNSSFARSFSRKLAPLRQSAELSQKSLDVDSSDRRLVSNSMESYSSNWNADKEDEYDIKPLNNTNGEDVEVGMDNDKYTCYTSFPSYNEPNSLDDINDEDADLGDGNSSNESDISVFIYTIHETIQEFNGITRVILDTYKLNSQNNALNSSNTNSSIHIHPTKGLLYPESKLSKLKQLYLGI